MVSHTFPGIAPIVVSTRTFDAFLDKSSSAEAYFTATGRLSPAANTNIVKARLRNLSANTKTAYLIRLIAESSIATDLQIGFPINPDSGDFPAFSSQLPNNKKSTGGASQMKYEWNVNDTNDVASKFVQATLQAGVPLILPLGEVLPPNSSIDFRFLDTTSTTIYTLKLEWYEE